MGIAPSWAWLSRAWRRHPPPWRRRGQGPVVRARVFPELKLFAEVCFFHEGLARPARAVFSGLAPGSGGTTDPRRPPAVSAPVSAAPSPPPGGGRRRQVRAARRRLPGPRERARGEGLRNCGFPWRQRDARERQNVAASGHPCGHGETGFSKVRPRLWRPAAAGVIPAPVGSLHNSAVCDGGRSRLAGRRSSFRWPRAALPADALGVRGEQPEEPGVGAYHGCFPGFERH